MTAHQEADTRPALLYALAARLGDQELVFESAIHGSSMAPAIPAGSRLRVELQGTRQCAPGDIIFFSVRRGYMVHRVIGSWRQAGLGYVLTIGDRCFIPDPPVREDEVLGTVVAIQNRGDWGVPGPLFAGVRPKRIARWVSIGLMRALFSMSASAGRSLGGGLTALEFVAGSVSQGVRRRLHPASAR